MAFTYDLSTNVGKVRNLIGDAVDSGHLLEDADITSFLAMTTSDLYMTAYHCLMRIANSQALLAKMKQAGDYKEDLRSVAKELRENAKMFKEMSENIPAEAQAEHFRNDFSYRDITDRKALRNDNT